eukprot:scaffold3274_cov244-Pinguiococcus_pyrenoidosus.AAC.12
MALAMELDVLVLRHFGGAVRLSEAHVFERSKSSRRFTSARCGSLWAVGVWSQSANQKKDKNQDESG